MRESAQIMASAGSEYIPSATAHLRQASLIALSLAVKNFWPRVRPALPETRCPAAKASVRKWSANAAASQAWASACSSLGAACSALARPAGVTAADGSGRPGAALAAAAVVAGSPAEVAAPAALGAPGWRPGVIGAGTAPGWRL